MKESFGLLVHRDNNGVREYLIVHPSGNYNKKASYSIPKGEQKGGIQRINFYCRDNS